MTRNARLGGEMARVPVKVVIDAAHMKAQEAVRQAVAATGFQIEQCIPEIGAIFGSADESALERLAKVDGVLHAQPEAEYSLPPRDPRVPQ